MGGPNRLLVFMETHTRVFTLDIWPLSAKSWVDLRKLDDIDFASATRRKKEGVMDLILTLDPNCLIEVMDCVAGADDTTRLQETSIRDQLAIFRSALSRKK